MLSRRRLLLNTAQVTRPCVPTSGWVIHWMTFFLTLRMAHLSLPTDLEEVLEETVRRAMLVWNIPGLALVVIKDDQVVHMKGHGICEIGKPNLINEHTIFAAASLTKAFTATAIGLLVQEGRLAWDDPVAKYLPAFLLYDIHSSQLITIRDLLCHRAGLGSDSGEALLYSRYSPEEVLRRIRYIPPGYSFRAGFGYSSLMYIAAGKVISAVSGMSWDDYVRQHIFAPLGMTDSVTNSKYFGSDPNIATPHEDIEGQLRVVGYRKDAHLGAAASICASASDIALWLRLQLNDGHLDGKQIVDPMIIAETHTPHTPLGLTAIEKRLFPSRHFSAYGLGWFLSDLHGRLVIEHMGNLEGMLSNMVMIPEEKIGIVVFTNKKPHSAIHAVPHFLLDRLLGVTPRDWIQSYIDLEKKDGETGEQARKQREKTRVSDSHPSLALDKYVGTYESDILGKATVCLEKNELQVQLQGYESMSGTLQHWHYDTYLCKWDDPLLGESLIPFISDGQGEITEFRVKIRDDYLDSLEHVFRRRAM